MRLVYVIYVLVSVSASMGAVFLSVAFEMTGLRFRRVEFVVVVGVVSDYMLFRQMQGDDAADVVFI